MDAFSINKEIQALTRSSTPTEQTSAEETNTSEAGFDALLRNILSPQSGASLNEEELFAAIIQERLETKIGSEAAAEYGAQLAQHKGAMSRNDGYVPVEDAANEALADLVESGTLTQEQADEIYSESFRAAQLDDNLSALYDGRGSSDDPTVATAEAEAAMASAKSLIDQIESGTLSLTGTTSASDSTTSSASTNEAATLESTTPEGNSVDGSEGFVFKPESEHEKKLVILLPTEFANNVEDVLLKDEDDNIIERGQSSGYANGGREHFRFNKAGGDYPQNITVEVRMKDGSIQSYEIPNPGERYD